MLYRCPALGLNGRHHSPYCRWSATRCPNRVRLHQCLCGSTWPQSTDTVDCPVATARAALTSQSSERVSASCTQLRRCIYAITRATLTPWPLRQRDRMERRRFHGEAAVVRLVTLYPPQHMHIRTVGASQQQAGRFVSNGMAELKKQHH